MKRIFTYLLLVFSVLSCREKEVLPAVSPSDIRFSVPKVADTKSVLIEDKSQLKIGDDVLGYSVFAARYIPSETGAITKHQQFMTNIKIQSTDDGSSWDYDSDGAKEGNQHFYWSPGAVHKFFAVYPYYDPTDDTYDLGFEYGINEAEHALQATGKHETGSGTQKLICTGLDDSGKNICPDILYGVQMYSEPYKVGDQRAPIKFTMSHALSAVSLRIRNASEYVITGVAAGEITGFENASEYVRLSDGGPVWGPLSTVAHTFDVPDITSNISAGQYHPDSDSYWCTVLMIPQNFGSYPQSPSFTFTVTFGGGIGNKTYTINFKDYQVQNTAEHAYSFLPGRHYEYNLNVTSSAISCHVDVVPWIEDEPIKLN